MKEENKESREATWIDAYNRVIPQATPNQTN